MENDLLVERFLLAGEGEGEVSLLVIMLVEYCLSQVVVALFYVTLASLSKGLLI